MNFFRNIAKFFTDVISEFKRVTWPTREATLKSTGVVLVLTIAVALFLGVIDVGLSESVKLIIR
ncbi:MAG: preprotein translocase subunit SecE [SAR324 cluster bacterium]|nr:preprotein translocase subunit SecE [SAR324 cluster bacterium]MCH8887522.1 preprotein translocase subunit SecE [SAR324 cluster bacterium]